MPFTPTQSELHVHEGDTYTINLQSNNYYLMVTMNNIALKENTGYTFSSSGALTIPNVRGAISITAASKETYAFTLDDNNPVVERPISISSVADVSSMDFTTLSNKIIKKITIDIPYSSTASKDYTITGTIKIDGKESGSQSFNMVKKTNGTGTLVFDFSGKNINANTPISVNYTFKLTSGGGIGNQTVAISQEKITVEFSN